MKRKVLAILLTLVCTFSMITGCGIGTVDNSKGDGAKGDSNCAQLTIATWDGGIGSQWLENAAQKFEEKYKDSTDFEEGKKGVDISIVASRSFDGSEMANTPLTYDVYFVEAIDYYAMVNANQMADMTEVITSPLSAYGEEGTILDKMNPTYQEFLKTSDGKYYAIPFYEAYYGFVYDMDLWDKKSYYISADGGWAKADGQLSAGADGQAGTDDDGLPATYDEFAQLIERIKDSGVTPFAYAANAQDYMANVMYAYWAQYEGAEQMALNFTFDGTAKDLIEVSKDGKVKPIKETKITFENGYELQKQAGKYYVLDFMENVLMADEDNYTMLDTHVNAQKSFIKGGTSGDNAIAMLAEGSWWENEAKDAFKEIEDAGYERHNYGLMPIPHATADKIGQKDTNIAMSNSYGFVANNSTHKDLAMEFMSFLHTDEQLSAFTAETNMTRGLDYNILPEDEENLTTYAQSVLKIKEETDVIYPYSSVKQVISNGIMFANFGWAWLSNVDGYEYKNPFLYFRDTEGANAVDYFHGQYLYFQTRWQWIL